MLLQFLLESNRQYALSNLRKGYKVDITISIKWPPAFWSDEVPPRFLGFFAVQSGAMCQ